MLLDSDHSALGSAIRAAARWKGGEVSVQRSPQILLQSGPSHAEEVRPGAQHDAFTSPSEA